jgi:hypothetical protein
MNERERALNILKEARDLLSERLTQRILENSEQILDDARGDSYLGDIESTYELFGMKLSHLNQLINNLPAEPVTQSYSTDYTTSTPTYHAHDIPNDLSGEELLMANPQAITGPLIVAPPALPAPRVMEDVETIPPSFQLFITQIHTGEIVAAGRTLAVLLDLSEARGVQCSRVFHRHWEHDSEFFKKAMTLRSEITNGSFNSALMLLAECFGLIGIEAIGVLQTLRARLENS